MKTVGNGFCNGVEWVSSVLNEVESIASRPHAHKEPFAKSLFSSDRLDCWSCWCDEPQSGGSCQLI